MDFPIIKLTVEHMRHEILHAFNGYCDDIKGKLSVITDEVIKNFDFNGEVSKLANALLRETIKKTLESAFLWDNDDLFKAIRAAIIESLKDDQ